MKNVRLEYVLHIAQLAVMEAGDFALEEFTKAHVLKEKTMTKDIVSSVDIESEKRIVRILSKSFPKHTIITEERKLPTKLSPSYWWIDPLDGTISYIFGLPYWGVSLCLVQRNDPLVGVIYLPLARDLFWAIKGKGAYKNYKRIRVSGSAKLKDCVIGIDYGYKGEREAGVKEVTYPISDKVKYLVTYSCTAAAIALVAEGKLGGYIHHMGRRFDLATGALLVTEAGGKVSDTIGKRINWKELTPVHFAASNGKIHNELLSSLVSSKKIK